jgi:hypothetical protein
MRDIVKRAGEGKAGNKTRSIRPQYPVAQ